MFNQFGAHRTILSVSTMVLSPFLPEGLHTCGFIFLRRFPSFDSASRALYFLSLFLAISARDNPGFPPPLIACLFLKEIEYCPIPATSAVLSFNPPGLFESAALFFALFSPYFFCRFFSLFCAVFLSRIPIPCLLTFRVNLLFQSRTFCY